MAQGVTEIVSVTVFFNIVSDFGVGIPAGNTFADIALADYAGILHDSVSFFEFFICFAQNNGSGHIRAVAVVHSAEFQHQVFTGFNLLVAVDYAILNLLIALDNALGNLFICFHELRHVSFLLFYKTVL